MLTRGSPASSAVAAAGAAGAAAAGWVRDAGGFVSLATIGDFVGIGATVPVGSEKARLVGAIRIEGTIEQYSGSAGALGPVHEHYHKSATPAAGDVYSRYSYFADNDNVAPEKIEFAREEIASFDITDGSESGYYQMSLMMSGTLSASIFSSQYGASFNGRFDGTNGPDLGIFFDKATNGKIGQANDVLGTWSWYGYSSDGFAAPYMFDSVIATGITAGAEEGTFQRKIKSAGANKLIQTQTGSKTSFLTTTELYLLDAGALGPVQEWYHDSTTPLADDVIARKSFFGRDSTNVKTEYARMDVRAINVTNGSEAGSFLFYLASGPTGALEGTPSLIVSHAGFQVAGRLAASGPLCSIVYDKNAAGADADEMYPDDWYMPDTTSVLKELGYVTVGFGVATHNVEEPFYAINLIGSTVDRRLVQYRVVAGASQIGFFGVTPVPKAAAIASPTSDVLGTKAAIDALRAVVANLGFTA